MKNWKIKAPASSLAIHIFFLPLSKAGISLFPCSKANDQGPRKFPFFCNLKCAADACLPAGRFIHDTSCVRVHIVYNTRTRSILWKHKTLHTNTHQHPPSPLWKKESTKKSTKSPPIYPWACFNKPLPQWLQTYYIVVGPRTTALLYKLGTINQMQSA